MCILGGKVQGPTPYGIKAIDLPPQTRNDDAFELKIFQERKNYLNNKKRVRKN